MSRAVEGDRPTRFGSSGAEGPLPLSSIVMAPRRRLSPPMSLFLDIGEGAGLASASGVRPFLPPLLAGALARGDIGIDFDHTDWKFLESPAFLLVLLLLAVVSYGAERSGLDRKLLRYGTAALAMVLGAMLFAGS